MLPGLLDDLDAESADLDARVAPLDAREWSRVTPAPGWTVGHQIAHLAWTDQAALLAATDEVAFYAAVADSLGDDPEHYVDRGAAALLAPPAELLERWREMLGDRLLVVPYEALVADPAAWTRRLLAHCGLPEEPQVFAPHENARPVATASMVQVRRPIGRESVGSADPYRPFLEPFIAAYYD